MATRIRVVERRAGVRANVGVAPVHLGQASRQMKLLNPAPLPVVVDPAALGGEISRYHQASPLRGGSPRCRGRLPIEDLVDGDQGLGPIRPQGRDDVVDRLPQPELPRYCLLDSGARSISVMISAARAACWVLAGRVVGPEPGPPVALGPTG